MQNSKQVTVSSEGLKKLQEELEYLKTTKRKEVAEAIKTARAFGDLSENSEYDEAKNEQAMVEARIAELEVMLQNVQIIDETLISPDIVHLGTRLIVRDPIMDEEVTYQIVGSKEANPMEDRISDESPVGKALLGHRKGDLVEVETPGGTATYTIVNILK